MIDKIGTPYIDQNHCPVHVFKIHEQVPDWELALHQHAQSQLLMTVKGLMTVETHFGIWIIPAQHALWIPSNIRHKVSSYGISTGYVAFVTPQIVQLSEQTCTMLQVTTLLKALLERVEILSNTKLIEKDLRLISCLIDEIQSAVKPTFYLPIVKLFNFSYRY